MRCSFFRGVKDDLNPKLLTVIVILTAVHSSYRSLINQHSAMERVNLNYSIKKHALPSKNTYDKTSLFKLESFDKQRRWKKYFSEKSNEIDDTIAVSNFGFKSALTPPEKEKLNAFEKSLYDFLRNIKSKRINTVFRNQLNKDTNMISKDPLLFIPADKNNNLYKDS